MLPSPPEYPATPVPAIVVISLDNILIILIALLLVSVINKLLLIFTANPVGAFSLANVAKLLSPE